MAGYIWRRKKKWLLKHVLIRGCGEVGVVLFLYCLKQVPSGTLEVQHQAPTLSRISAFRLIRPSPEDCFLLQPSFCKPTKSWEHAARHTKAARARAGAPERIRSVPLTRFCIVTSYCTAPPAARCLAFPLGLVYEVWIAVQTSLPLFSVPVWNYTLARAAAEC